MAGEAKPIDPNSMIYMARALRAGQKIPYVGEVLFGDAEKAASDIAYGFFPGKGSGMTTQLDPGVADLVSYGSALNPVLYAKLAANALRKGASKAIGVGAEALGPQKQILEETIDMGRRDAMKKIGKGAVAAAAVTGTGRVIDDLLPAIAKHAGEAAIPAGKAAIRQLTGKDLINDFIKYARHPDYKDWMGADELEGLGLDLEGLNPRQLDELIAKYGDPEPGVVERLYGVGDQPSGQGLYNDPPPEGIDEALMHKFESLSMKEKNEIFEQAIWKNKWPEGWEGLHGADMSEQAWDLMNKFTDHPKYREMYEK